MTIYFDKFCPYWDSDKEAIRLFLECTADYIIETIRHRGYIYLNQIYEALSVEWNTGNNNVCIQNPNITIVIGWEDKTNRWRIDID